MIYSKKVDAKSPDILSEPRKPIIYNVNFSDEYTQVSKRELKGTSIIKIIIDNSSNGKKSENITVKPVSNIINICISVIIPVIYGIWTGVIIPYCGKKLSILNNDSEFTLAGIIIVVISTIVYLIIFIGYNIYQSYKTTTISTKEYNDKLQQIKNYEAKVFAQKADLHLNEIVLHSININCEEKSKTLSAIMNPAKFCVK